MLLSVTAQAQAQTQPQSATFVFTSTDPAGEGFNDNTPREEIASNLLGNNPGATLGEIRQNVLAAAADRWSALLLSDVPIEVDVDFEDFGGSSAGGITLAGALNTTVAQNFVNAPLPNTLYPIALANSLAGTDLSSQSDIEVSVNSNEELSNSASGTFTWYYGFDGNGPFGTIDFLDVISHELGHGLGFAANVSSTTGNFIGGRPNSYTSHIFDASLGLSWLEMSAAQRVTSSRSDPNLTWDGPHVTGAINGIESFTTQGNNSSNDDNLAALAASFGGTLPAAGLLGNLILVDDGVGIENDSNEAGSTADLAQDIQNGAQVSGNIALIARGLVNFDVKVRQAQDAGAIAAVVYNNTDGDTLVTASAGGSVTEPTIPMIFISENSGNSLLDLLPNSIEVTIFSDRVMLETDGPPPIDRLRLHAPASFQSGSSISHWTSAATPNLLMEPSINSNISADLDLSVLLMKDIGWNTFDIAIPHLTYDLWLNNSGLGEETNNTGQNDDFDNDGLSNLEEYYHGTNPLSATASPLELTNGRLLHQRSSLPNDLILEYLSGSTLDDFTTFSPSETSSLLDGGLETAEAEVDFNQTRQFFRLRIQSVPNN